MRRRAAAGAVAAILGAGATACMAAKVDSGPVNIPIPNTLGGVYINWVTGANGTTGATVTGWDFNPYAIGSGTLLDLFTPNGGGDAVVGVTALAAASTLPPGATIGGASTFVQGVTSGTSLRATATQNVGIKFANEATGAVNYGYAEVQTTAPGGFPATITRYVYDDAGAAIVIPGGGVAAPVMQGSKSRGVQGGTPFDLPL